MAFPFRCHPCLQSGVRKDFRTMGNLKSHLGSQGTHNMGPLACTHPGCQRRSARADSNLNHDVGGVLHNAQWVVDPVLARDLAAEVERCRLRIQPGAPPVAPPVAPPAAPPVAPPAAPPAVPAVVNPGLGPVGVAAHPVGSQVLAPAPPSQEADEEEAGDEAEDGDDDEDTGTNYDSRVVKVTGIPLREEIFEILEEVVDDLAGRGVEDDLEGIKTSLFDLRRVCAVSELLALVKTLIAISRSLQRRKLVETLLVIKDEIKKTFYL